MIWVYCLLTANAVGFMLCFIDKRRAKRHAWRIPEKTLFLAALLGGAPGVFMGMRLLRHKTRHRHFAWGIPAIALIEYGALLWWLTVRTDALQAVLTVLRGG